MRFKFDFLDGKLGSKEFPDCLPYGFHFPASAWLLKGDSHRNICSFWILAYSQNKYSMIGIGTFNFVKGQKHIHSQFMYPSNLIYNIQKGQCQEFLDYCIFLGSIIVVIVTVQRPDKSRESFKEKKKLSKTAKYSTLYVGRGLFVLWRLYKKPVSGDFHFRGVFDNNVLLRPWLSI